MNGLQLVPKREKMRGRLSSYYFNTDLAQQARDPATLLVFVHSQRTGGVGFRCQVLVPIFGSDKVYAPRTVSSYKHFQLCEESDLANFRVHAGHSNFREPAFRRPVIFITLVRHPLYRASSLHGYCREKDGHQLRNLALNCSMEEFYLEGSKQKPSYFINVQTRRVCGTPKAAQAEPIIRKHYIGIGFTEGVAAFGQKISRLYGGNIGDLGPVRLDAERYDDRISSSFRDRVLADNEEDMRLYETVRMLASSDPHVNG